MINLNVYEIPQKLDKTKTWINVNKQQLLSREIKFRKYYVITSIHDIIEDRNKIYLILLDHNHQLYNINITKTDDYGRIKINLAEHYAVLNLDKYDKNVNIPIKYIEGDDESDVYLLEI